MDRGCEKLRIAIEDKTSILTFAPCRGGIQAAQRCPEALGDLVSTIGAFAHGVLREKRLL